MNLWKRLLRNRQALAGLGLVLFFMAVALLAPVLSPPDIPQTPMQRNYARGDGFRIVPEYVEERIREPQPPTAELWFGTDAQQYDIFHSLVWGTRSALRFGMVVTLATALIGMLSGAFSGYVGGWAQTITLRITDAFLAVPLIIAVWMMGQIIYGWGGSNASGLITFLNTLNLTPTMLAFILFTWMPYARIMNATVLQLKQTSFIQASEALGASRWRVVLLHLIPNALSPIIVLMARDVGGVVTFASALEAINLAYASEWGAILSQNRVWILGLSGNILLYWWVYIPITLAFILFGMAWNLLGDGLNAILNPKTV
jgi:peptide/nickel transport system permease protein